MRAISKLMWPFVFALAFITLSRVFILGAPALAQLVNLPDDASGFSVNDEADPAITARVARISFLSGDAQIRRADGGDWERVILNLPIVEGDEITTDNNARVEIQFDNNQHVRLAENAHLKIVTLKDGGIALSVSLGTMIARITRFEKDAFFEIDAPKTTVAVQKVGVYRIDAGRQNDTEIRVAVQNGEARVYSDNAGFTLKNNRSARIFIEGSNLGEWEAADSSRYQDEFDTWSLERDATIAQRLKDAFYDKYYDNDIYGADDLNGYGDWVHTASYGYVWRPYRRVTSHYADWSPYRYGHWRWIPPYGWTWVNDEPWGWATYHHGRWFYDDGYWHWSPYGYHRYRRSWWSPALVVVNIFNNNVCWYPLPYHYTYYNYNYYYNCRRTDRGCNSGGHYQPPPIQTGGVKPIKILPSSVVAMGVDDFGTDTKRIRKPSLAVANAVIAKKVDDMADPVLPAYSSIKMSSEIKTERPKADIVASQTKVGAAPRKSDAPLDKELRTTRIFGGRSPVIDTSETGGIKPIKNTPSDTRKTGAITRQPTIRQNDTTPPIRQAPVNTPPTNTRDDSENPPVKAPPTRQPPVRQSPQNDQPVKQPPRSEPAPTRQPPRNDQPVKQPPRSELTPTRQPPKQESKPPAKAPDSGSRKTKEG
ncbi:MAG: DUF6600 domain-containing protein [Pyrinomonadaceae bacterium]